MDPPVCPADGECQNDNAYDKCGSNSNGTIYREEKTKSPTYQFTTLHTHRFHDTCFKINTLWNCCFQNKYTPLILKVQKSCLMVTCQNNNINNYLMMIIIIDIIKIILKIMIMKHTNDY